jgi:CheY-like chemotaxis protein
MTESPSLSRVLVVEDGQEYSDAFTRFLSSAFYFERAGSGAEALSRLSEGFDAIFLDMRFDRVPAAALLGDLNSLLDRFNGDANRARRFLEDNQGTYILAAIRAAGFRQPAVISHDFGGEPRRWANLLRLHAPLGWLPDNAGPEVVKRRLRELVAAGAGEGSSS